MRTLWQDLRYGLRLLAKSPGFTLAAALTLAVGIGANGAIFSVVNALLLKPMPAERPSELVAVYTSDFSGPRYGASSYPDYADFRDRAEVFSGLMAYAPRPLIMSEGEQPESLLGEVVTGNYFEVLGVRAALGRTFLPEEDRTPGAHPVAVISHDFWQRRLGGDPNVVGRSLVLNNQSFTVVGVAQPEWKGMFRGVSMDVWLPMMMTPQVNPGSDILTSRGARGLFIMGRLRPGATLEQAQANFDLIARQQREAYARQWTDVRNEGRVITVVPESEMRIMPQLRGAVMGFAGLLLAIVGLVLLVACANIAGLLLARATARRKEIAIRLALGASRARLVRQLLTESLLLALLGGAGGLLLAIWVADLLLAFKPPVDVRLALDFSLDARVLGFMLLISLLTGMVFGLAPALQATKTDLTRALKDDGTTGGYRRSRLRGALVIAQVALSFVLLIGSGLFLRSLMNANAIDPGFNAQNLLLVSVTLRGYQAEQGRAFYLQLLERLRGLPGAQGASLTGEAPLQIAGSRMGVTLEGYERQPGEDMELAYNIVGPRYFQTMETPLVRGRDFTEQDTAGAPGVIIVNEALARRYFPGQDALGRRISTRGPEGPFMEIIGIARDGKYWTLGEEPRPFMSLPVLQNFQDETTVLIRTAGDPQSLIGAVREEIRALDRNILISDAKTMTEHMGLALFPARIASTALGVFGLVALLLASVGIYGVVAYFVGQRTREIGIRIALGARPNDILRLVLWQGMMLVAVGLALGLVIAFAVTHLVSSLLYGISPTDPLTFAGITALLAGIALLACYLPARRATKVDPMVALRYE